MGRLEYIWYFNQVSDSKSAHFQTNQFSIMLNKCMVFLHLQHPGSESVIQQDVKAQNLKAGAAGGVVGEARVVVMLEDGMSRDQSLYDHILNVVPHLLRVTIQWLQELV